MKIGEASETLGLSVQTIRFYEREGLVRAHRNQAGTRYFTEEDLIRLKVIRDLVQLGIPLSTLRNLTEIRQHSRTGDQASHRVNDELAELAARLSEQRAAIERALEDIAASTRFISNCYDCRVRPMRSTCDACPVSAGLDRAEINHLIWDQDDE